MKSIKSISDDAFNKHNKDVYNPVDYCIIPPNNKPLSVVQILNILSSISTMYINNYYFLKHLIIDTNLNNIKTQYEKYNNNNMIDEKEGIIIYHILL